MTCGRRKNSAQKLALKAELAEYTKPANSLSPRCPLWQKIIRVYSCQLVAKILRVFVSSWLNTKIAHFESIMQNKPNLLDTQMNVSPVKTKNYEQLTMNYANKNKPNSNPIKPKTNPKQTQNKPKTNPIKPNSNPIKPNSLYFSGGGYGIFSVLIRKAKTSACSSMILDIGFPRPCPAFVSTRSRIGFLPAALACRVATNFLA
jgi:hypothetical protein